MTEFGIKHGEYIAQLVSRLNPQGTQGTQSNVWVPLIFRALQLNGILVDEECCNVNINNQKQTKMEKNTYKPEARYTWTPEDTFTFTGGEFGVILNALRGILSTPEAAKILVANQASIVVEGILSKAVEAGTVIEVPEEVK